MKRKFVTGAALAFGAVLLASNVIHAQGRTYGYYYPDEQRFRTIDGPRRSMDEYGVPAFMQQRAVTPPAALPIVPRAIPARICLLVPDAESRVWFENQGTKLTGTSRTFETPPIMDGAIFKYHLKVVWKESGQDLSLERDVAVTAGQTAEVDFTEAAAALRKSRATIAARSNQ